MPAASNRNTEGFKDKVPKWRGHVECENKQTKTTSALKFEGYFLVMMNSKMPQQCQNWPEASFLF